MPGRGESFNVYIFRDTGPLGILTNPNRNPAAKQWYAAMIVAGHTFIVPSIADYEVRRELVRAGKTAGLAELDAFISVPGRYLELTDSALKRAATFWADVRNAGYQTADNRELDCDALIAAQAKDFGLPDTEYAVATVNVGHLNQFVSAVDWKTLAP